MFQKSTHKLYSIAANKANALQIKNTLPIDEPIWKAYLENHAANSKGEQALIDFVRYLNK